MVNKTLKSLMEIKSPSLQVFAIDITRIMDFSMNNASHKKSRL
jgi:hypothetical protein